MKMKEEKKNSVMLTRVNNTINYIIYNIKTCGKTINLLWTQIHSLHHQRHYSYRLFALWTIL